MKKLMKTSILIVLCLLFVGISSCSPPHKKPSPQESEKTAEYWFNLGFDYDDAGKYEEAIEAYKQAIKVKPDYAKAYYNLGNTYKRLGMYQESIEAYKQAIQIKPDYAKAYYNLGNRYKRLGMQREAIEAYTQAIRINPEHAKALYKLGDTYAEIEMYGEAIKYFERASEKGHKKAKHAFAWILSTSFDTDIRDGKRALTIIKPLVDEGDRDSMTLSILAAAYAENRNFSEAIKIMHEAIEKTDENEAPEYYKKLQLHLKSYENKKPMRE